MKLNLINTITEFLQENTEQKFTAREIAEWIFKNYPDRCRQKQQNSTATINLLDTDSALLGQIVSEIGSRRMRLQKLTVKPTDGRPRKYYFTKLTDGAEIDNIECDQDSPVSKTISAAVKEHDLYPMLSEFLLSELEIRSKRIDEKRSSNTQGNGGNKWLYPDLVGIEDLSRDWNNEIKHCAKEYSDKKTKLWSFEVKLLINRSNVREVFFQTVSNSSWANLGYLVAAEIQGANTLKELRMLSSLHGIGFIRLDTDNPSESQIMIPAEEKNKIDWDTANRLADENKDFLEYIKLIRQFYQTGEVKNSDWDMCNSGY
jgi:hypothetical protein